MTSRDDRRRLAAPIPEGVESLAAWLDTMADGKSHALASMLRSQSSRIAELEAEVGRLRDDMVRQRRDGDAADARAVPTEAKMRCERCGWNCRVEFSYATTDASPSDAARDVLVERMRQVSVEGWTPEHDDQHKDGCLSTAAACYALHASSRSDSPDCWLHEYAEASERLWPFDSEWFKPSNARRELVKAGALILAEIERLDRAALGGAPKC